MGGEAAPLGQPWRASHRGGHDDAKALFEAHRHVISRGSRRTGDAELFAGGQDAQQIFLLARGRALLAHLVQAPIGPRSFKQAVHIERQHDRMQKQYRPEMCQQTVGDER